MCLYAWDWKKTQVKKRQKWGYYYLDILPLFLLANSLLGRYMNNGYYMYKCKKAENDFYTVLKSHKELSSPESILHVTVDL